MYRFSYLGQGRVPVGSVGVVGLGRRVGFAHRVLGVLLGGTSVG